MLGLIRAIGIVVLAICSPALAFDIDDIPAERWPSREFQNRGWRPAQSAVPQSKPLTKDWDFGLHFRIESLLCRTFSKVECPRFSKDQNCEIDFDLLDNSQIKNVKITSPSDVPAFDALAKKLILNSAGSPELKLPKSQKKKKTLHISSTFFKAGTSRWVQIRLIDADKITAKRTIIQIREEPSINHFKIPQERAAERGPWPTRQMIKYKNENGEWRLKLVPADSNTP